MFDRPRNWKWMVPMFLIAPCLVWWKVWARWDGWNDWAIMPAMLVVVLSLATLVNLWAWVADRWSDMFANVRAAMNSTPEVRMFEAAKGMHPEAVKALLVHRRNVWRIRYVTLKDVADWIIDEAPTVHAGFVDFVLEHSNDVSLMPKRFLVEGSTKFDPDGLVTDYQQYDDLLFLLQQKMMVTQAYGNQSPHLLPPWTVALLQKRFGLDGGGYGVDGEMSEAMKSVVKSQGAGVRGQGNGEQAPVEREASGVPDVIARALDGLEQTQQMKVRSAQLYKSNS